MPQQLDPVQLKALADEVGTAFPTTDVLREALPENLRWWAGNNLPFNQEKSNFIVNVLCYANDNGHVESLLWALHGRTAQRGLLELIEAKAWFVSDQRERVSQAVHCLNPCDEALVDRSFLRDQVREFLAPKPGVRRLLVIPPSAAPGKSHSGYLLRHVANALDLAYIPIDCLQVRDVIEVARIIGHRLNLYESAIEAQLRDASRPGPTFLAWLIGRLDYAPVVRRGWVVFDHVVKPKPSPGVESIALTLADAAAQGEFRSLYVTLIDSDFTPPAKGFGPQANPLHRDSPLTPLTSTDIATYIVEWAKLRAAQIDLAEAFKDAEAAFAGLPQPLTHTATRELVQERLAQRMQLRNLFD